MEKSASEETEIKVNPNQYIATYRCPNCGTLFKKAVQKGIASLGQGGYCPYCGMKDGSSGVGNFQVIKANPQLDSVRSYN
jgi:DNA-directed RNA polymerase subunit RPC12/RpoP